MKKQDCRTAPPPTAPLGSTSRKDTSTDGQQCDKYLYCGYCNIQCLAAPALVKHSKLNRHKLAVFADSGRDVFWQFEPPPVKEHNISAAVYG